MQSMMGDFILGYLIRKTLSLIRFLNLESIRIFAVHIHGFVTVVEQSDTAENVQIGEKGVDTTKGNTESNNDDIEINSNNEGDNDDPDRGEDGNEDSV